MRGQWFCLECEHQWYGENSCPECKSLQVSYREVPIYDDEDGPPADDPDRSAGDDSGLAANTEASLFEDATEDQDVVDVVDVVEKGDSAKLGHVVDEDASGPGVGSLKIEDIDGK